MAELQLDHALNMRSVSTLTHFLGFFFEFFMLVFLLYY